MVTYIYWIFMASIAIGALIVFGVLIERWVVGLIVAGLIMLGATTFYYFYLEQMLVKRWGGSMAVSVPSNMRHVAATWKDDNLWIENYDPEKNQCIFQEYSRGNILEGRVVIKNCNPLRSDAP